MKNACLKALLLHTQAKTNVQICTVVKIEQIQLAK